MEVIQQSTSTTDAKIKSNRKKKIVKDLLFFNSWRVGIIVTFLLIWQLATTLNWIDSFLIGSPKGILEEGSRVIKSGQLLSDTLMTVQGTVVGFILGSFLGSVIGLMLWYSRRIAKIIDPFIVALNGLPKIALAPMIIIWFGSGIISKIALATLATFIVALLSAYQGTHQIDRNLINLMKSIGSSKWQIFRKVVIPSSLPWIISAFRLNIGFALIAVVGGEFISSDKGLGKMVFVAGNLFNLNVVWVGVFTLMAVAIVLYVIISKVEKSLLPWQRDNS